jgi:hypothetical protein
MWLRRDAYEDGLDPVVEEALREWLAREWPFERLDWAERDRYSELIAVSTPRAAAGRR